MREKVFARDQSATAVGAEHRHATRLHLQVPLFVRGTDAFGEDFMELAKTLDISSSGAFLTSPRPLQKQSIITLTVPAPAISNSGLIPAGMGPMQARVIRQKEVGDVHLIGVKFLKSLE